MRRERGLGRGQREISVSRRRGGPCQLPPFSALPLFSTATSLDPWPGKEHTGGFPECITSKVKPATEAAGAGPWTGSWTRGNPDGGKGTEAIPCGKWCWQLGSVRREGRGKVRVQSRISHIVKDTGHRHPATKRHKHKDTNSMMPLQN